jgi:hypothetical protein
MISADRIRSVRIAPPDHGLFQLGFLHRDGLVIAMFLAAQQLDHLLRALEA